MCRAGLLFFAVLEMCHIFGEAQCPGLSGLLSPCGLPSLCCGQTSPCGVDPCGGGLCGCPGSSACGWPTSACNLASSCNLPASCCAQLSPCGIGSCGGVPCGGGSCGSVPCGGGICGCPGSSCASDTSCGCSTSTCIAGCQSPFASAFNQFANSLEIFDYSILADCQLDETVPCSLIEGMKTILTCLRDELKEEPRYVKGQYTGLLSCMLDQLDALCAEYSCS